MCGVPGITLSQFGTKPFDLGLIPYHGLKITRILRMCSARLLASILGSTSSLTCGRSLKQKITMSEQYRDVYITLNTIYK